MKWENKTLEEIASSIQTGPFGSQLHQSDYSQNGIPVVMPKDLVDGKISESSIARVSVEHVDRLSRHKISVGDIIYSRRGDVGRCAYATAKEQGWLCGTGCLKVTIDSKKADSQYVFFQLQKAETIGWVVNHAVGSTMLNLNTSILSKVPIDLPSLDQQKKIVEILSSYDDLIENNRKQIKLLEEAAQRLYKEWFVDLRFPGHENTKIIDGVPEGWKKSKLQELIKIHYGKDHKLAPETGNIPVYGSGGIIRYCNKQLFDGESVLVPRKGSLNNIIYVNEPFWTVDTMFYTTLHHPHTAIFTYFSLLRYDMYSFNIGAAVPSMTVGIIDNIPILIPPSTLLKKYDDLVQNLFVKISAINKSITLLTEARDRLLPKLMSGEIEV